MRVSAKSISLLQELHTYVQRCDIRGPLARFSDVAADCFDGSYFREELDDLIRRRILHIIPYDSDGIDRRRNPELCGTRWSVNLSERAVKKLWPERVTP